MKKSYTMTIILALLFFISSSNLFSWPIPGEIGLLYCQEDVCNVPWNYQNRVIHFGGDCDVDVAYFFRQCPSEFQIVLVAYHYSDACLNYEEGNLNDMFQDVIELLLDASVNPDIGANCIVKIKTPTCWTLHNQDGVDGYTAQFCCYNSCCWVSYALCPPPVKILSRSSQTDNCNGLTGCQFICNIFAGDPVPEPIIPFSKEKNNNSNINTQTGDNSETKIIQYSSMLEIKYYTKVTGISTLIVYDNTGNQILQKINIKTDENDHFVVNTNKMNNGIYHFIIKIKDSNCSSGHFIINNN